MPNKYELLSNEFTGDVSAVPRRILAAVCSEPWAIQAEALNTILLIASRANEMTPEALLKESGTALHSTQTAVMRGDTAIIPVSGPIFKHANLLTAMSGATSLEVLSTDFNAALDDDSVKRIVLDFDSPGGQVNGVSEMADMIRAASEHKEVVAYVSGMAASAAYWLASAAPTIVMSPTSMVGSIGVVLTSSIDEDEKVVKIVSSQSPKKLNNPTTDDGRAELEAVVNELASVFINAVGDFRGVSEETVLADFGQGGVLVGASAIAAGMADALGSLENSIAGLSGPTKEAILMGTETTPTPEAITPASVLANHPAIADHFRAEGAASVDAQHAYAEGVAAEQTRQAGIEALAMPGHEALIAALKADTTVTVEAAAVQILGVEKENKAAALQAIADSSESLPDTTTDPAANGGGDQPQTMEAQWESMNAHDRAEFNDDYDTFKAFTEADAGGLVRILNK